MLRNNSDDCKDDSQQTVLEYEDPNYLARSVGINHSFENKAYIEPRQATSWDPPGAFPLRAAAFLEPSCWPQPIFGSELPEIILLIV